MLSRALSSAARAAQPCHQMRLFAATQASGSNAFTYKPKKLPRADSPWSIYAWQVSNTFSIMHRVSGVALTGLVYGGSLWYLTCGNAAAFATAFGALPILLKFPLKAAWVVPNAYHAMNGLRHLDWDLNKTLSLKELYGSARHAVFFTGLISLFFLGSALFGESSKDKDAKKKGSAKH